MSKVALLGDTHFSLRNGDKRFIEYFRKIYTEWFFPELEKRGIKKVIQLGDLFDKRVGNDSNAVENAYDYFFTPTARNNIEFITLIGNHDAYWKTSIKVNSPEQLLNGYPEFLIFNKPTTYQGIDFIPWICDENRADIFEFIKKSKSKYCVGHFEITGFQMYKGVKGHDGLSPTIFNKYKKVFSGHYHTRSEQGNILYTGSPGEYTWSDADDPKGFYVFDDETGELEFVQNPFTMFQKVYYDEDVECKVDLLDIKDKFVRLYILKRTDLKKYDKWIQKLQEYNPHELKIVEESMKVSSITDEDINVQDTMHLIEAYVDGMDTELDKERLKKKMRKLYVRSQEIGE